MTTTSVLFTDPIYGVGGTRFFPGSSEEAKVWFFYLSCEITNSLENGFSINDFLKDPERWSGLKDLRAENDNIKIDQDYSDRIIDSFIERYNPLAHWTPLELWMSLFYKCLCYQTNPYKGALCDIECEAYDLENLDNRFNIKKSFLNGEIERALFDSGQPVSLTKKNYDHPVEKISFSYLYNLLVYNPNQRDKIKKEISRLFQQNTWILDLAENKKSLMGIIITRLVNNKNLLINLQIINNDSFNVTIKSFCDVLVFLFMLGFPKSDLTPYTDLLVNEILYNLKISSKKEENLSKEVLELKAIIKNLKSKEEVDVIKAETIQE